MKLRDIHIPFGDHVIAAWMPTGRTGMGLIAVPSSDEPLVVEWSETLLPAPARRRLARIQPAVESEPEYIGVFLCGSTQFTVREHYQQVVITDRGRFQKKFKQYSNDGACCTEIAKVLSKGDAISLTRITSGVYRGQWSGEVYDERERPAGRPPSWCHDWVDKGLDRHPLWEETWCRLILDVSRARATLFRWRSLQPLTNNI